MDALGGRATEVRAALDTLRREDNVQLWVVYVDSFEGINAQDWADQTARLSDLGLNDMLLAVAIGDRCVRLLRRSGVPTLEQSARRRGYDRRRTGPCRG